MLQANPPRDELLTTAGLSGTRGVGGTFDRMRAAPFIRPLRRLALAAGGFATAVFLASGAPASPRPDPAQAIAAAVDVTVEGQKTRFSVLLSQPVAAHAQLMERPDRVIVDLPEVTFHLPNETGRAGKGLISLLPLRPVRARALAGGDRPRPAGDRLLDRGESGRRATPPGSSSS